MCRKLCFDDNDVRMVPLRATAGGHGIHRGEEGREHLSRCLECGKEYRDGMHCFQIARLAYDW